MKNSFAQLCALLLLAAVFASTASAQSAESPLPLRRVTLYKHGVGYFERRGPVNDDQSVTFSFGAAQMNDVLKSLVVLDLGGGKVGAVTFDSSKPLDKQLENFAVTLDASNTAGMTALLGQLKGARVEVRTAAGASAGAIVGLEKRTRSQGGERVESSELILMGEGGELRNVALDQIRGIRLLDAKLREDLERHLAVLQSATRRNARHLKIAANGKGTRDLFVSYVMEAPVWKAAYRVVTGERGRPLLQGWAIVDNTQDEDWENVTLSLVAGMPVSFIQDLQQPRYRHRPVVAPPDELTVNPQLAEASLAPPVNGRLAGLSDIGGVGSLGGSGSVGGRIVDPTGAAIPGASVQLRQVEGNGSEFNAVTNGDGRYTLSGLPPGVYEVRATQAGFKPTVMTGVIVRPGDVAQRNITLNVGSVSETVEVSASAERLEYREEMGAAKLFSAVNTQEIGELFEYRIEQPVTIKRGSSALIPIVQTTVEGESVSLYNAGTLRPHPMSALYLTNTTGLTLEAGPVTLIEENTYAGEALVGRVKPGEKRFIPYAVDLGCRVSVEDDESNKSAYLIEILNGEVRVHHRQARATTYSLTNVTPRAKTVYVEHPRRKEEKWELVGTGEPAEKTESYYRFKATVAANSTLPFNVTEELPDVNTYQLSNLTSDTVALFIKNKYLSAEMKQALDGVLEVKAQLAALNRQVQEKQQAASALAKDQERMRENLRALGKSEEERRLVSRYVGKLAEDEDRLEKLRQEEARLIEERAALQQRLDGMLRSLAMQHRLSS